MINRAIQNIEDGIVIRDKKKQIHFKPPLQR